ncbi:MAG: hypothetical protein Q9162_006152 [Coniocarpon cinnabarinum]
MELSSPSNPEVDSSARPSRRKSGRVTKQTKFLSPGSSTKRKRTDDEEEDGDSRAHDSTDPEPEDDANEDEPDEELRERRRKQKSKTAAKGKPAAKKQKPNGISAATHTTLVRRPAKKTAKAKPSGVPSAADAGGLYGKVFGGNERLDSVAADWLRRFAAHEANALAELVNLVLRCAGCEIEVDGHDIEDPDNATNKLSDIQDEFQAQNLSEYPLISRSKGTATFKKTLTNFVNTFIHTVAAKGLLTGQLELIENIQIWIGSMSSAPNRPLRHTATLASLEITSALTELARSAKDNQAKIGRQIQGEKKNKKVNQARVKSLAESEREAGEREQQLKDIIKDWFDVVFVHRYRDVDARIRVDCVAYLSEWACTYSDEFLDGQHLRYLGWVLSDESAQVRSQVTRDMQKLYADDKNIGLLRQFTDRFRPRMVEVATRDGDLGVRCFSIELLNILRQQGLLETDDIDTIGKLMFDNETRVRNTVAPFFAAIVEDLYQAKRDEFEGVEEEALQDFEQNEDEDDPEAHRLDWLRLKSIAQLLRSYDTEDDNSVRPIDVEAQIFNDTDDPIHSRVSLATEAFFDHVPVLKHWESLAGLLLKDITRHANIADPSDVPAYIENAAELEAAEQAILLDVLNVSVKYTLRNFATDAGGTAKKKKTKRELEAHAQEQESAAQRLAALIPRLLKKFGESPGTASAVLRLEAVLKLDVFAQLREDSTTFANLLEDIRRQFMSHEAASVINSAKRALLHARNTDELQEVTDGKLSVLWDDTTLTFARLCKGQELSIRGSLHSSIVHALSTTVLRIANLASISNCIEPLEKAHNVSQKSKTKSHGSRTTITPINCLLDIVRRGILSSDSSLTLEEADEVAEDALISQAMNALIFYFTWHVLSLRQTRPTASSSLSDLYDHYTALQTSLRALITSRRGADSLRIQAASLILEIATLFSTLRHIPSDDIRDTLNLPSSARLPSQARKSVLAVFIASERDYARKASKSLVDPAEDTAEDQAETQRQEEEALEAEPESSDDEMDEDEDEDVDAEAQSRAQLKKNKKDKAALLAEQALCQITGKLVLALVGGCIDDDGATKKRLLRNRNKLGKNYAEIVNALEKGEKRSKPKTRAAAASAAPRPQSRAETVEDREEPAEGDEGEDDPLVEEDGEEDLRRRELIEGVDDDGEEAEARVEDLDAAEVESVLGD